MKIAGIIRQDSGVGLYRLGQPIQFIDKTQKEKSRFTPFTGTGKVVRISEGDPNIETWTDETLMGICKDADIIWSTFISNDDEILKMLNLRKWSGARWVVDMDDDIYNIPVDNAMKAKVEAIIPKIELCLQLADGITVSVPRLAKVYAHLNPNIYVNPNGQDVKFWDKIYKSLPLKNNKKVRIGWRGASGHGADLRIIEPVLNAIKKDFNVEFVTMGARPPFKTRHQDWVGCLEFPETLAKLNLDIALVPLSDNPYNQSKSNIAIQEFGMLRIPVVASPVENQLDMDGVSYAVSNHDWYDAIAELIDSRKLRKKKGEMVYTFVKNHYDLTKQVKPLISWLDKLPHKDI